MDPIVLPVLIAVLVVFGLIINKRLVEISQKQKPSEELLEVIRVLREGSKEDRVVLLNSLQKNTQALNERLDNAAAVINDVKKNVGEMNEIGRGMKELQEFLVSPKLRGNIGEHVLKELLGQMLPKSSFHLQYSFRSGDKVDAVIKTEAGIIPIDSKFPMENFRKLMASKNESEKRNFEREFEKDVKKHIDSISGKYILTDEGTIDYALMYIPSEAVYYEIVNNSKLFDYGGTKRVLPVSPTTFYAYLKAILMSFEGQKIEEKAKEILSALRAIQKDYSKVEEYLYTLERHLTNSTNMMSNILSSFSRLGQRIVATRELDQDKKNRLTDNGNN